MERRDKSQLRETEKERLQRRKDEEKGLKDTGEIDKKRETK